MSANVRYWHKADIAAVVGTPTGRQARHLFEFARPAATQSPPHDVRGSQLATAAGPKKLFGGRQLPVLVARCIQEAPLTKTSQINLADKVPA
jgi:hypothetical protein